MKKILLTKDYINHHKDEDCCNLAEIIFDDLYTEDTIGDFQMYKLGKVKISVYTKKGTIPHLHLEKSDKTFICCICLKEEKYFRHKGIKDINLSSKQKKDLYNFLKSENKNTGLSYYKTACLVWNSSEDNPFKVPLNNNIPNYRNMVESIHE